jgi:hypothetical protein
MLFLCFGLILALPGHSSGPLEGFPAAARLPRQMAALSRLDINIDPPLLIPVATPHRLA